MDVARARRVGRPAWVNLRTVLGLLLFGVALLAGNRLLAVEAESQEIWVATRDLAEGTVLAPGDVEPAAVDLPARVAPAYAPATVPVLGDVLTRPLRAGELVSAGWLASSNDSGSARSITIPVEAAHAVGGALQPGDRVDVFVTFDPENVRARTLLVARAVEVQSVVKTSGVAFGETALVGLTLSVSPEQASRLAFAIRAGLIDIARVDGSATAASKTATVRAGDFP